MIGPDLERQELARDLAAFAAKAMREIAVVARITARMADEGYSLSQAMSALAQLTGKRCEATILGRNLKPLAERARILCDRDQMAAKGRRRIVRAAVEGGGVVFLPPRKPPAGNGLDHPDGAA